MAGEIMVKRMPIKRKKKGNPVQPGRRLAPDQQLAYLKRHGGITSSKLRAAVAKYYAKKTVT